MLTGITSKNELKKLQLRLSDSFNKIKSKTYLIKLGHQGGSWEQEVQYSEDLNIWWLFSKAGHGTNRYWNAFGIGNPSISNRNIIVEINYPVEGYNNRIAGGWAIDNANNYYLYHNGKIAGGRKGIGKSAFLEYYTGEYIDVQIESKNTEKALVAVLDDFNFVNQIADFVNIVATFKYPELYGNKNKVTHKFNTEFDGSKQYKLPLSIKSNGNHGLVVNALSKELLNKGLLVANNGTNGRIDLYLYNKQNIITNVFEIKTTLSIQSICAAIGQLLLYTYPIKNNPRKIFVCPLNENENVKSLLKSVNIEILFFQFKEGKPFFLNLDKIIKQ